MSGTANARSAAVSGDLGPQRIHINVVLHELFPQVDRLLGRLDHLAVHRDGHLIRHLRLAESEHHMQATHSARDEMR